MYTLGSCSVCLVVVYVCMYVVIRMCDIGYTVLKIYHNKSGSDRVYWSYKDDTWCQVG